MKLEEQLKQILIDARENGVLAKGYLEVVRSIQQKKAKLVIMAKDIDSEKMAIEIKRLCNIYETPAIVSLTKVELGKTIGLDINTGFVSIKIAGFNKKAFSEYFCSVAKA